MPGVLKARREESVRFRSGLRYLAYAAGEVLLIFIGITLAIAFENWNDQRRTHALEIEILQSIEQNLVANLEELDRNIDSDRKNIQGLEPVLENMINGLPWNETMGQPLQQSFLWASPYFATSGYENLKQLGLHLVSDSHVKDQLVGLFENTYARLLGDNDEGQRMFEQAVMLPVRNRELENEDPLGGAQGAVRVRDYEGALERGDLLEMLSQHRGRLLFALRSKEQAHQETVEVLALLREYLLQSL